jgi:hypothetical protein
MRAEFDPVAPIVVRMTRAEANALRECLGQTNELVRHEWFTSKGLKCNTARAAAEALGDLWSALDDLSARAVSRKRYRYGAWKEAE